MLVGQLLRLLEFPGEDEVADLAEVLVSFGIVVVVGAAGPEGAFIQGDPLLRDPAEDHGPHDAVAKGQRLRAISDPAAGTTAPWLAAGCSCLAWRDPPPRRKLLRATKAPQKRRQRSRPSVRFSYDAPFISQPGDRMRILDLLRDELASTINYICFGAKRRRESRTDSSEQALGTYQASAVGGDTCGLCCSGRLDARSRPVLGNSHLTVFPTMMYLQIDD